MVQHTSIIFTFPYPYKCYRYKYKQRRGGEKSQILFSKSFTVLWMRWAIRLNEKQELNSRFFAIVKLCWCFSITLKLVENNIFWNEKLKWKLQFECSFFTKTNNPMVSTNEDFKKPFEFQSEFRSTWLPIWF